MSFKFLSRPLNLCLLFWQHVTRQVDGKINQIENKMLSFWNQVFVIRRIPKSKVARAASHSDTHAHAASNMEKRISD